MLISHTEYTKLQPHPQKVIKCETYVMDTLSKLARKFRHSVYSQKKPHKATKVYSSRITHMKSAHFEKHTTAFKRMVEMDSP